MDSLLELLRSASGLCVLTGAGCSTSAGIPDYRDELGRWKRSMPVMLRDFVGDADVRRRFWARSCIGWTFVEASRPGAAHRGIAALEAAGFVRHVITQNVDGLHGRAGSKAVIELHGNLATVACLGCGATLRRPALQHELLAANPEWARVSAPPGPDGDAIFDGVDWRTFRVPACRRCGGILKPQVVFFGEGVPSERVRRCYAAVRDAGALLVIGSSLSVLSGFRLVREAHRLGKPIAAINLGRTRGDDLFTTKITEPCDAVLPALLHALVAGVPMQRSAAPTGAANQPLF